MSGATTIYIHADLKAALDGLKWHPKESYNDVIERLVSQMIDDEPLSEEAIRGLEESLEDIKCGRLISEEILLKEYGITCKNTE